MTFIWFSGGQTASNMVRTILGVFLIVANLLSALLAAAPGEAEGLHCLDWYGNLVEYGTRYIPAKDDPCLSCKCERGFATMCRNVLCDPPKCKRYEQVEGQCCIFNCIDAPGTGGNYSVVVVVPVFLTILVIGSLLRAYIITRVLRTGERNRPLVTEET